MRWRLIAVPSLMAAMLVPARAQQAQPAAPLIPCRDRTVDEYLVEIHKRQRNKNPFPSDLCIFAWCPHRAGVPESDRPASPPPQAPHQDAPKAPPGESSSKPGNQGAADELRGTTLYYPIEGARNVEAGDYYFAQKNYRAALSRFQEALEKKPDDAAIHLRLARTCEKLDDPAAAYEHYDAAVLLSPDGSGAKPAREGLERLRPQLVKAGADAEAIHQRNAAALSASCPPAKP